MGVCSHARRRGISRSRLDVALSRIDVCILDTRVHTIMFTEYTHACTCGWRRCNRCRCNRCHKTNQACGKRTLHLWQKSPNLRQKSPNLWQKSPPSTPSWMAKESYDDSSEHATKHAPMPPLNHVTASRHHRITASPHQQQPRHACMKQRPTYMVRETYIHGKRDLYT